MVPVVLHVFMMSVADIANLLSFQVKVQGSDNVNWETFIYDLHPYRDSVRLSLIKDNSSFQQEARRKEEEAAEIEKYKPEVFKLTENTPPHE